MTGKANWRVDFTRCNQGLAGEDDGNSQAVSGSRAGGSSPVAGLIGRIRVIALVALICATNPAQTLGNTLETCLEQSPIPTSVTSVHVQPESGTQPILDEINFSACSIDLSMYLFTSQDVLDALEHAIDRGIRVRVILERQPFGSFGDQQDMFDRLVEVGAEVRWGPDQFTFTHAKYMIVDSRVLLVTNQNFTGAGFNSNREFGIVSTDARYVSEAVAVFEADWSGTSLRGDIQHLVVSPINARARVLDLINDSTRSIWMYSEVLRDEDVTRALSDAAERGVNVRVLVNPTADEDDIPYFLDALEHGVQVRVLTNPYVHSKVMIVDGKSALVGSQNYSYTSLDLNREIGVVLTDADNLEKIVPVYERDWARAEPVDSISQTVPMEPSALTLTGPIGRISFGRWGVV